MDLFDDFEMKPITKGLGFHKKAVQLKNDPAGSSLTRSTNPETSALEASLDKLSKAAPEDQILNQRFSEMDALVKEFEDVREGADASFSNTRNAGAIGTGAMGTDGIGTELKVSMGLPRPEEVTKNIQAQSEVSVPEVSIPPSVPKQEIPQDISFVEPQKKVKTQPDLGIRRGSHDTLIRPLKPAAVSFASASLDSLVILALSLIFLVSLLVITEVDLGGVMSSLQTEASVQVSLLVLYVAIMTMYTVILRSFFGRTLGEWTFDFQMGTDDDIKKIAYPFRVVWRSVLTLFTGIVLLPLISLMLDIDVAARLTGLQLYRKND